MKERGVTKKNRKRKFEKKDWERGRQIADQGEKKYAIGSAGGRKLPISEEGRAMCQCILKKRYKVRRGGWVGGGGGVDCWARGEGGGGVKMF